MIREHEIPPWRPCKMLLAALLLWLIAPSTALAADSADDPDELARLAVEANPAIGSVERQISALRHKADAVSVWRDPVFAVEYSNVPWDSWALGDSPMSGVQFKVQQTFSLPGKNDRREQTVQGETRVKRYELGEKKNQLEDMVRRSYWKLALVRQLRKINERHVELVDQLMGAVKAKYQVGKVGQHDLLSLQVLKQKIEDDLGDFDQRDRELTAALNAALHRTVDTPIKTPEALQPVEATSTLAELVRLSEKHRPLLQEIRATARWQRLAAEQAGYERWPDITVWAGYRLRAEASADPGTDFVNLGLSVPLPFDYTGRAEAAREQHLAQASAADESLEATLDEIRARLESSLAAWQRAALKATEYQKSIIPAADTALKATLAAYQSDMADFASLYQAELQLLQLERAAKVAEATTWIEHSRVVAAVGVPLKPGNR